MSEHIMTRKQQKAYDAVREKILDAVKRTRAGKPETLMDLSGRGLVALPPEIGQLTALTQLHLYTNHLTALPPEIGQLKALTTLYLHNNRITAVPPEIWQLRALTQLFLSLNQLTALPPEIGHLTALTRLDLDGNQLTALPREMGKLSNLRELWLMNCGLQTLPPWLRDLKQLEHLFLHRNPALQLPETVLGVNPEKDYTEALRTKAHSILDYYFGRQAAGSRPLNEVKVILVGRGGAGKTSTVRALRGLPFNDAEESTPGIALCDWQMDGCKGDPVTAHIWDFAGQVITHSLHQFFFSTRSVYVLVLTGRENNAQDDAEYWLRLIKAFGTDDEGNGPPVIVALNKWDVPGCRPRVDRAVLRERYPFIREFVQMDCKSAQGIPELKKQLCIEVDHLKWVRDAIKPEWDAVRRALTGGEKERRPHISYGDFRNLCAQHGLTDPQEQDSLAEILHGLGIALNYRNDPRLREATVLLPHWLTENVYALVRQAEEKNGTLTPADVDTALQAEKDPEMRAYLVRIMERFEIAYAAKVADDSPRLVPQALPDQQPEGLEVFRDAKEATRLRYTYQALPEGLVARAIVRLHEFIAEENEKKLQWASGAVLERNGARALLRREPQDRVVMLTATGPEPARRELAGLCRSEMRDIHRDIDGLDPVEETQYEGAWVDTETLEADEQNKKETGVAMRSKGTVPVNPAELNNAYSTPPARDPAVWKPAAFLCYSKENVPQRKRLELELTVLSNEGFLDGYWHDHMVNPGDEWDDAIQQKLGEADVIIILCSADALATEYIWKHEIPKAMLLHDAGKAVVVPVVLEACQWERTNLKKLNALPDKARPLTKFTPRSGGWNQIAEGLAKVCKTLQQQSPPDRRATRHLERSGLR
ncbi:MAG TPA: COR domain-containing protein [Verrucomicrobiales bacterium]|nr:COR domain-containing protein [Verrucomicrobiales bacterium]